MDRVGARNTLIVLLTLVLLTVGVWFVMLLRWATDKTVEGNLLAAGTTLLGLLTGSAVSLGASPKVPSHEAPAASEQPPVTVNVHAAHPAERLAVGSEGQVLTADSSSASGVRWATPSDDYNEPGNIAAQDLGLPGEAEPLPDDDNLQDTKAEDV
jgi:hypothetical protein